MPRFITTLSVVLVLFALTARAHGQWGYYDPTWSAWNAQLDAYNQAMDAFLQQQMQQAQQRVDQAYADMQRFLIDYYRQQTGDYATPDHEALRRGDILYCQHNPVRCQQNAQYGEAMSRISAQGHAQRMADIQSWGQTMQAIGQSNSDVLDLQQQGYMNNSALQSEGQAGYVQGAIYGEATFIDPSSGLGYSLPIYPDPTTIYTSPDGYPLSFDYATSTWYQQDASGWWYPLTPKP